MAADHRFPRRLSGVAGRGSESALYMNADLGKSSGNLRVLVVADKLLLREDFRKIIQLNSLSH